MATNLTRAGWVMAAGVIAGMLVQRAWTLEPASAPAAPAATNLRPEDADDRTPMGLARQEDRELPAGIEKARTFFHATTAEGKRVAELAANYDFTFKVLERAVRERFGAEAAEQVDHLLGWATPAELDRAVVEEAGDKAAIKNAGSNDDWLEVKVNGRWRFDSDGMSLRPDAKAINEATRETTPVMSRFTKELTAGRYKTADDLQKAMTEELDKIWAKLPGTAETRATTQQG